MYYCYYREICARERRRRTFSVFFLCSAPTYHANQIISAGVMAAAEMAKKALAGGTSSTRSDGGKLEGERNEEGKDEEE